MLLRTLYTALLISSVCARPAPEQLTKRSYQDYGSNKVRGVNLGGWGILEPWITPSIFENVDQSLGIVDEFTLTQNLPLDDASGILNAHWSSFYTLADFQAIAAAGINTVRIPVGYWAFFLAPGDPYIQGFAQYLDQAITWAGQTGLKVWIDLHGAPGSQNGFDNSGRRGPIDWPDGPNIGYTQQALQAIIGNYSVAPYAGTVVGIEVLNEPNGYVIPLYMNSNTVADVSSTISGYYDTAVGLVQNANNQMLFIIHDAFESLYYWTSFANPNAVLDTHHYEGWSLANIFGTLLAGIEGTLSAVVGEFCGAQTDCTKYLNGYNTGARYDGTLYGYAYVGDCATTNENGVISQWTADQRTNTRKLIEAQLDAYDQGSGWIFWTAKTESSPYWDFLQLVQGGIFPQPFTDRQFPGQVSGLT